MALLVPFCRVLDSRGSYRFNLLEVLSLFVGLLWSLLGVNLLAIVLLWLGVVMAALALLSVGMIGGGLVVFWRTQSKFGIWVGSLFGMDLWGSSVLSRCRGSTS